VLELPRPSTPVATYGPCWEQRPCSGATELVWQALREGWSLATFGRALADYAARRESEV
jgi:hypothetical protein